MLYPNFLIPLLLLWDELMKEAFTLHLPYINTLTQSNHSTTPGLALNDHTFPAHLDIILPPARHRVPDKGDLRPANCDIAVAFLCATLASDETNTQYEKWVWFELSGCAIAYYLPVSSPEPSLRECNIRTFGEIMEKCATDSRFKARSMNVRQLPDFGDNGTTLQWWKGRFIMASERLPL